MNARSSAKAGKICGHHPKPLRVQPQHCHPVRTERLPHPAILDPTALWQKSHRPYSVLRLLHDSVTGQRNPGQAGRTRVTPSRVNGRVCPDIGEHMTFRHPPVFDRRARHAPRPAIPVHPLRVHGVELHIGEFTFIRRSSSGILGETE